MVDSLQDHDSAVDSHQDHDSVVDSLQDHDSVVDSHKDGEGDQQEAGSGIPRSAPRFFCLGWYNCSQRLPGDLEALTSIHFKSPLSHKPHIFISAWLDQSYAN